MSVVATSQWQRLRREVVRFGTVGTAGYVVDVGVFNLLRYDGGGWPAPLADHPVLAKVLSVVVATVVTFLGNRHWTWTTGTRRHVGLEYPLFFALNAVGMFIAVACLYVSHYVLGFTSALADNIAANGVGFVLGAGFRFWSYRRFVFLP